MFEYRPIDLQGPSFRLIRLFRGPVGHGVRCELFDAWLDCEGGLPYDALSYCWGETEKPYPREIELNGEFLPVTKNLLLALQHLRHPYKDRILWVDAICIDQENVREKGHQILQMTSIYKKAESVVIWLGPATKYTDLVLHNMSKVENKALSYAHGGWAITDERWLNIWQSVVSPSEDDHARWSSDLRIGVNDLLTRPWFDRAWIIREVASARVAEVVCGTKSVSARMFALLPLVVECPPLQHCQAILDVMPGPTRRHSWWAQGHDLYTLLVRFRGCQASQPRDKIYALLGISSDGSNADAPLPDYAKPEAEVVRDTIAFLLKIPNEANCSTEWTVSWLLRNLERLPEEILLWAAENGMKTAVHTLLRSGKVQADCRDAIGQTPLLLAAQHGHETVARLLLGEGMADPTAPNTHAKTPLRIAAERGQISVVQKILRTGEADDTLEDRLGWTPLWLAALNGHDAVVELLLDYRLAKADKTIPGHKDAFQAYGLLARTMLEVYKSGHYTPTHHIYSPRWCPTRNYYSKTVRLLFETGNAQVHQVTKSGEDVFVSLPGYGFNMEMGSLLGALKDYLAQRGEESRASELLISASRQGRRTLVRVLIESKMSDRSGEEDTLHVAASNGHEDIVRLLLETGRVDVNTTLGSQTPLWGAAWQGHTAVAKLLISEQGIEVNARDLLGRTPLAITAELGDLAIVALLLGARSVEIGARDEFGQTPLDLARGENHTKVVQLLEAYSDSECAVRTVQHTSTNTESAS
jgi:ankyrin repeat protein